MHLPVDLVLALVLNAHSSSPISSSSALQVALFFMNLVVDPFSSTLIAVPHHEQMSDQSTT